MIIEKPKDGSADIVIVNANELVTLHSKFGVPRVGKNMEELAIINNGALAIKGDKIIFVGKTEELEKQVKIDPVKTKRIDAKGKLVTPGFVDPHVHLIFAGSRENELAMKLAGKTYMEILASGGGILKTVRETRKANISELVDNGMKILDKMLEYGTTTIEGKSGYGLTTGDEIKSLEAMKILNEEHPIDIISTFLGAHAIPPEYKDKPDDYVNLIITKMLPKIAMLGLAEFCDVFCEEGVFTIDQTRKILLAAEKYGFKKIIHIDEIVDTNGAALAAELHVVQTGHLLKSNDAGLKEMAKKGVIASLLPGTPFCLMLKEYADARKMIDFGIPIAIATDLNPNCWTESMLMVIVLSCYNMKLSPAEALTAATLNAACAIQRQNLIGSLEVGKQADIVIFDVPNYFFLSYQFGVNLVSKVIKKGKIVVER
ncbi:MAG TPA: imidazolonepropionase [Candidatus Bathyarchaeia archaeon]|nr:imidazolonepropionase [Candidatus Bathyarchaeia archaeon]